MPKACAMSSGSSSNVSSMKRPGNAPYKSASLLRFVIGVRRTTGVPLRVMTISSPRSARSLQPSLETVAPARFRRHEEVRMRQRKRAQHPCWRFSGYLTVVGHKDRVGLSRVTWDGSVKRLTAPRLVKRLARVSLNRATFARKVHIISIIERNVPAPPPAVSALEAG